MTEPFASLPMGGQRNMATPSRPSRQLKLIFACSLGNALEMYDFTVYSFLAILIGKLFFPSSTPYGSLLLSVATFGIGFFMRPLGGFVIGNLADSRGRKYAMTLTIGLMVVGTLFIGMAPTHAQAGWIGPVMIVIGRLIQGFSLGGEVGASTALLMESGGVEKRGTRVSWQFATQGIAAILGALTAALLYGNLSQESLESWGWRLPFLAGLVIAPLGFYIRANLDETYVAKSKEASPLSMLFRDHRRTLITGIFTIAGGTVSFYMVVYYMPTYMIRELHLPASLSLLSGCVTGIISIVVNRFAGKLTDRLQRRKPIAGAAYLALLVLLYPVFWLMTQSHDILPVLLLVAVLAFFINLASVPNMLLVLELFPVEVRASGLSITYAVGVAVFGGTSQLIATWLLARTGNPISPAFYMMLAIALNLAAIASIREPRRSS